MTGSTHKGKRLAGVLALVLTGGCVQLNAEHCGNQGGDATCAARDETRPFCSVCFDPGGDNGCTDQLVPLACRPEGSAAGSSTTVEPSSSSSESTAVEPDTGLETSSGSVDGGSTTTTTTNPVEGSSSDTTSEPYCGDGMLNAAGESCDGTDFGGATCLELGMGVGMLVCTDECVVDTSACCFPQGSTCMSHDDCCSGTCMGLAPMIFSGTCTQR